MYAKDTKGFNIGRQKIYIHVLHKLSSENFSELRFFNF